MILSSKIFVGGLGLLVFFGLPGFGQGKSDYATIISRFEQWKTLQYKKGVFVQGNRCNPDSVSVPGYKGSEIGIPNDIDVFFTDINRDGRLDALVTFRPLQCDGGLALMNHQVRVLVLSAKSGYVIDDTLIDNIARAHKRGWLVVESVSQGTIYGTYFEQRASDGRGNASIRRPFGIDFSSRQLRFDD